MLNTDQNIKNSLMVNIQNEVFISTFASRRYYKKVKNLELNIDV